MSDVPEEVRKLLAEHIRTVMALELVLLLRSDPSRLWTAHDLFKELRSDREWAERELQTLSTRGLVTREPGDPARFHYPTPPPPADPSVAWLAGAYPERRFSIIQAMYAFPASPLQSFADAFKLRKEPPDG